MREDLVIEIEIESAIGRESVVTMLVQMKDLLAWGRWCTR